MASDAFQLLAAALYVVWGTIQLALGRSGGLSSAFLPILLAAVGVTIVSAIVRMRRAA